MSILQLIIRFVSCLLQKYQILSSDEHAGYMRKRNLNPYSYRPDIVYEVRLVAFFGLTIK